MLIGELVKKSGLSKSTIRHYEDMGLLHHSLRQAGSKTYREYDESTLKRIEIIENGKKMGFSLKEGKHIVDALMSESLSKADRVLILQEKVQDIEVKIAALKSVKSQIESKIVNIEAEEN